MEFHRNQDPKKSIDIGLFRKRKFKTNREAGKWVMQNHVKLLEMPGLASPYPSPEQFAKLREIVQQIISITEERMDADLIADSTAQLYRELHEPIGNPNLKYNENSRHQIYRPLRRN